MELDNVRLAWAAGLFEGEGWISIQGKSAHLGVQMCDLDILIKFQNILGMGHIHPRSRGNLEKDGIKSRKDRWQWRVTSFELVQAAIAMLWPWLGIRRRARAKEVLIIARTARKSSRRPYKLKPTINMSIYDQPEQVEQPVV